MPVQHPSRPTAGRRRFLAAAAGAAGVLVAGCRPLFRESAKPSRPDPDVTATARALERTQELLAAYAAVADRHPKLASELRAFSERHEAHSAALRARLPAGHAAKRSTTPTSSPTPTASSGTAATGVRDLLELEREASTALVTEALEVRPTLAQVFASMSACAAAHVELLGRVR